MARDAPDDRGAPLIALAGNPNTGKTTLFNRLTGSRQRVGNYPGITVEKTTGVMHLDGHGGPARNATVLDLPGTYSLAAASADEEVVIDVLSGHSPGTERPDLVVCVVDAANLRRNLFLVSQIAETGTPMVVALNMVDAARAQGIEVDAAKLSDKLGVPVVATVAARSIGIDDLRQAVERALDEQPRFAPVAWPEPIASGCARLRRAFGERTGKTLTEAEGVRLLFDVESDLPAHLGWPNGRVTIDDERRQLLRAGHDPLGDEARLRYAHLDELLDGTYTIQAPDRVPWSARIDRLLTHRLLGLAVFGALMFVVFASIYWLAQPLMDAVDGAFAAAGASLDEALAETPMLRSLVVDGVVAGVGGVIIFLPQILILFLFIAVLEDSGYMARAAFLMDKAFSWCGLNGKSFVPMLSSFACAVPSIMGTRTIEDPKARLTTILVAPLMSCSARLPVYVLMIGAFIQPVLGSFWAGATLFGMHLVGLVAALPVAMVLNRWVVRGRRLPFVLEMPPYRLPRARDVAWRMYRNGREFVVRAGTIILAFSIVIWALSYFPRPDRAATVDGSGSRGAELEASYLGQAGQFVQPLFAPAGFDWKLTVGVLASFPAREIIVSTLGIVYNVGGDELDEESPDLRRRLADATWPDGRKVYTPAVAVAVMVFFAFCMQCASTVAVIARESGWRWAAFSFGYMTALAWLGAVASYQLLTALGVGVGAPV